MPVDKLSKEEKEEIKRLAWDIYNQNQLTHTFDIYVRDRVYLRAIVMLLDDIDNLNARISILEAK